MLKLEDRDCSSGSLPIFAEEMRNMGQETDALVDSHYGCSDILRRIDAALRSKGKDPASLSVDDLAPIDEFHTRGRESTLELARLVHLRKSDRILDVGCGLGGTARLLAHRYGCRVAGIDLTRAYIEAGKELTRRIGMADQVELRAGSALRLPYPDGSFDVVWTEHAQMNIQEKQRFYSEISRVLKPGGSFLFHDVFRGCGGPPFYPTPWADDETISALATEQQAQSLMTHAELAIDRWISTVETSLAFFKQASTQTPGADTSPLGIHLLMGDKATEKLRNYRSNLSEDRVRVAMGKAHKCEGEVS